MPNPYHLRARIDRLWRHANSDAPAYRRLKALDAVVRELFAPTDQARRNHQLYLATDPYDVARHLLRDLYDGPGSVQTSPLGGGAPHLCGAEGAASTCTEQETIDEDDDPW